MDQLLSKDVSEAPSGLFVLCDFACIRCQPARHLGDQMHHLAGPSRPEGSNQKLAWKPRSYHLSVELKSGLFAVFRFSTIKRCQLPRSIDTIKRQVNLPCDP